MPEHIASMEDMYEMLDWLEAGSLAGTSDEEPEVAAEDAEASEEEPEPEEETAEGSG